MRLIEKMVLPNELFDAATGQAVSASFADPDLESMRQKMNELINALRR